MNALWSSLHFLRPHALWGLLLLPAAWWWWRQRRRRANVWREIVDPHLLPHLLGASERSGRWGWLAIGLGYALAVLALAGPSWRQGEQTLWEQHAPLVVALDLSSAIAAADLPPSRLLQARSKLATLLRERQAGQVALVAYADDAFTVAPLTDDAGNVALFLDALAPEVMPADGQRADRALAWSAKLLRQAGYTHGDILLLTDHADTAAESAAAAAAAQGYRVSVLGLGSENGATYRGADGMLARARLDAGSLRRLAARGGGDYRPLSRDDSDLASLGVLRADDQRTGVQGGGQGLAWLDEGYWLLPPLMLLGLLAFRRGAALVVIAAGSLAWALPSQAAERDWWQRPDQRAHARLAQGVQAYRSGDYAQAERAFTGQDDADGLYNRGNALARQGRYDEAIAAYDAALRQQPGMADAIANRAAVERARKPSRGQGDGAGGQGGTGDASSASSSGQRPPPSSPQPPPPPDQQAQPRQAQQQAGQRQQAQPQQRQTPAGGADGAPPAADQPADAKAQQAADAAQRERMQRALAAPDRTGRSQASAAAAATETPQERERRQALEAWLRRIPDEPGGLLKAKFRIEHERREREGR